VTGPDPERPVEPIPVPGIEDAPPRPAATGDGASPPDPGDPVGATPEHSVGATPEHSVGATPEHSVGATPEHSVGATVGTMFGRDSLYMVASSLNLLAGVLVTPVMTRVLGLHQYGIFAADLALLYVLYYTANLGMNIGIQRLFSQDDGERRSRNLLAASLVIVFVITGLVYLTGPLWSPHLGFGDFPLSTRLTTVWSGFFAMTWICLAVLRCNERLMVFATVCLMQSIVGIGAGTIYAFFNHRLATEVLAVAIVVQAAAVVLSLSTITPRWRGIVDVRTVEMTLRFSIPIVPLQISTFVLSASDRFIILRDLGPGPTGRYQVAYTLGAVGISMLTFLNLAWLPRIFAIKDPHARAAVLAHSRDGLYRLLVPVTLGIALGGPIALRIWAPPSFRTQALIPVILLVVTSTIPVCTSFVHSRLMLSEGRSGIVAIVTVVAALANIGLNLAMVPHLGINGSALATLITYTALAAGMASLSRLLLKLPRPPILLWVQLGVTIAVIFATRTISTHGTGAVVRLVGVTVAGAFALRIVRRLQKSGAVEAQEATSNE
jgi:O-antigen/teichoic acid export membrane protein